MSWFFFRNAILARFSPQPQLNSLIPPQKKWTRSPFDENSILIVPLVIRENMHVCAEETDLLFQSTAENVVVKVDMKMTRFWLLHLKDGQPAYTYLTLENISFVFLPIRVRLRSTLAVFSFSLLWIVVTTVKKKTRESKWGRSWWGVEKIPNKWHGF